MKDYRNELKNLSKKPRIKGVTGFSHLLIFEKLRGMMDRNENYPTAYSRTMGSSYRSYVSRISKGVIDSAVGEIAKETAVEIEKLRQYEFETVSNSNESQKFSKIKKRKALLLDLRAQDEVLTKIADVLKIHISESRTIMTTHLLSYSKGLKQRVDDDEIERIISVSSFDETLKRIEVIKSGITDAFERYGKE